MWSSDDVTWDDGDLESALSSDTQGPYLAPNHPLPYQMYFCCRRVLIIIIVVFFIIMKVVLRENVPVP